MKQVILYPPNGGEGIIPHPTKVEYLKSKGWVEEQPATKKVKKVKEKDDGES